MIARAGAAAGLVTVLLGGCSTAEQDVHPYRAEIDALLDSIEHPEIREALADSTISDLEHAQLREQFAACVREQDIVVELHEDGSTTYSAPDLAEEHLDEVLASCGGDDWDDFDGLYVQMRDNPDNEDVVAAILDCLKRVGVTDQAVDLEEFRADDSQRFAPDPHTGSGDVDGCWQDPHSFTGGAPDYQPEEVPEPARTISPEGTSS